MGTSNFILISLVEALIVCLFATVLIFIRNRQLRKRIKQLRTRLQEAKEPSKDTGESATPTALDISYQERLNQQIENTKEHHFDLGTRQDIALDLDPDAPLPRRTAALRHAFLIAEKEATAIDEQINWDLLASRYQQLLSFNADYAPEPDEHLQEDLTQARDELQQAQKRINNLERFKAMYFDLEELWEKCRDKADVHYSELKSMAAKSEQPEDFHSILEQYHASYAEIGVNIEHGVQDATAAANPEAPASGHLHELRRLRTVAAEQHQIISELQSQLNSGTNSEQQLVVVEDLKTELTKQSRYLQESETCIRLIEDELATANRELEQIRKRANQAAELKVQVKELQDSAERNDQIVTSLKQENRRLAKKLKMAQEAPPEDSQEARGLRKELTALQGKYNDLEEKFLNLKLKE